MSVIIQGYQLREISLGVGLISEPAAVLPATATANIFTVSGGRVIVTSLVGTVTTATTVTATTLSIGTVPTVGTAGASALATAVAVASLEVGTMVCLPSTIGGALRVGTNASTPAAVLEGAGFVVSAGSISITTSATNTGAMKWDLTYIPYDTGASVVAV